MKRIILRNLSTDLQELITDRMNRETCDAAGAVLAILNDASIERMVEHDVAIVKEWFKEDEAEEPPTTSCGHVQITIQCGPPR